MSTEGSRGDAQSSFDAQAGSDVLVPARQVIKFMNTLRQYSESCSESRRVVDDSQKRNREEMEELKSERKRVADETACNRKQSSDILQKMVALKARCTKLLKRNDKQKAGLQVEKGKLDEQESALQILKQRDEVNKALGEEKKICAETSKIHTTVSMKENFVCSCLETMKICEVMSCAQYNRTMYAGTLSKQMTRCSLDTLEQSL